MNAVAVAHGFAQAALQHKDPCDAHAAGCALARQMLTRLWEGVGMLGSLMWGVPLQNNPLLGLMSQWLSPYQANPLGINPLRHLLEREVDFLMPCAMPATDVARRCSCVPPMCARGRAKILLALACRRMR